MIKVKVVTSPAATRDDGSKVAVGEVVFLPSAQMPLEVVWVNRDIVACKTDLGILALARPVEFVLDVDGEPLHGLRKLKSA